MPGRRWRTDTAPVQDGAQELVQVPWLLPRLETSATAISATVVTNHSSGGTVCCNLRRWDSRPVCTKAGLDLLAGGHLLVGGQPREYGQPRDQRGVRAG